MNTEIYTYFTKPGKPASIDDSLLYSAEGWVKIRLRLETAGPVAVSTRQDIFPVLSGKGILLPPNGDEIEFSIPKGNRVFIGAESINRVKFTIEPIPWLERILLSVEKVSAGINGLGGLFRRRGSSAAPAAQQEPPKPPCPPPLRIPFFK